MNYAEVITGNAHADDRARDLGKMFGVDHLTSQALYEEAEVLGKNNMKDLKKDIDKCADAVEGDKLSISSIEALLANPGDKKLQAKVSQLTEEDMKGDSQALVDDNRLGVRAAYMAALDQELLDRGELGGKPLTSAQKDALQVDRNEKFRDARNCLEDRALESLYIKFDQDLLVALQGADPNKLQQATGAVKAARGMDMDREGARPADLHFGTGYIGQDQRSIESSDRLLRSFSR